MSKKPTQPSNEEQRQRRHREARGVKQKTLSDLAREVPADPEPMSYFRVVHGESDRGAIIMGSALLEHALTKALKSAAGRQDANLVKNWFEGATAPFGTFAAKIQLGRVMAIYGSEMAGRLHDIKEIRNAFSHSCVPLDFNDPVVAKACDGLQKFEPVVKVKRNRRLTFLTTCIGLARQLEGYAVEIKREPKTPRYR
jgi:hypothetical protein